MAVTPTTKPRSLPVCVLALYLACCPCARAQAVRVVGDGAELLAALQGTGQRGQALPSDAWTPRLSDAETVALCLASYPEPLRLSATEAMALERFVAAGGRAYVEFTAREDGEPLFGIACEPEVRRALHQRLVVADDMEPLSGLTRGDLLDEHNSACLAPRQRPEGAKVLLNYGSYLGTYRAVDWEPAYSATVDLGEVRALASVSQRYGAGQPDYYPERVELWLGEAPDATALAGVVEGPLQGPVVRLELHEARARYVRLVCRKFRRSPVTDFFFMGEVEALDAGGANVALGRPYMLNPEPNTAFADAGGELTDGVVDGGYEDGRSVGWATQAPELWEQWPALLEVRWGRGTALMALSKFSDFRAREYRPTGRWEGLMRHIALSLAPPERRREVARRYVPLTAWTEPRVWAPTDTPVALHVETAVDAEVSATTRAGARLKLRRVAPGRYKGRWAPTEGEHAVAVCAATPRGDSETLVRLRVSTREAAYQRAVDRNMRWFERSGVLPKADGSAGVWSQRCLAWFDGGPIETLASPFRVDCNAATAQALYLYGELAGSERWRTVALSVARSMLPHQYRDPSRASFGGWPWLYERDESVYFWDDNTRVAVALLWLYTQSGDEDLLRAGLRTMELCRQVAQPDGILARHVITASRLDEIGREGFRRLPPQGLAIDFDLKRWAWAYGVTGDRAYADLLQRAAGTWGGAAGVRGLPFAARDDATGVLADGLLEQWRGYVAHPQVKRWGVPLAGPGDYGRAFVGDCSVTTTADDPLTDQLYST
ncbi:MAG: hypothetical protein FJX74_17430, partial [Armatimonadetes bacterium]|nr:hypothetical protein [Armatimonadota bacterium]